MFQVWCTLCLILLLLFLIIVNWPFVGENLRNLNWSAVFESSNQISEVNKVITSLIDRQVPSKIIRQKVNNKVLFNKNCVNAFHNKQNAYCLWSQNRSLTLGHYWERIVKMMMRFLRERWIFEEI